MKSVDVNLYDMKDNEVLQDICLDGSSGYSDTVKLSNKTGCTISGVKIVGGKEDCIDINRGSGHIIKDCLLIPTGNFVISIKGGAEYINIENCTMGHAKEVDIDLGNWSDQSAEQTRYVLIKNCKSFDGKPITIRCLWAQEPLVLNTPHKLKIVPPWQLFLFTMYKKFTNMFS